MIFDDIKKKPIVIIGQGPSAEILKQNIELFRDVNVIWATLNRYHIFEDEVLSVIDRKFQIIWCSALVRYEQMNKHLSEAASRGALIMSKTAIAQKFTFKENTYICDHGTGFSSIFSMLCAFIKLEAKEIYLIGFDGRALNMNEVYYRQECLPDNFRTRMMSIQKDTRMMNHVFWDYVEYSLNVRRDSLNINVLSGSALTCFKQKPIKNIINEIRAHDNRRISKK